MNSPSGASLSIHRTAFDGGGRLALTTERDQLNPAVEINELAAAQFRRYGFSELRRHSLESLWQQSLWEQVRRLLPPLDRSHFFYWSFAAIAFAFIGLAAGAEFNWLSERFRLGPDNPISRVDPTSFQFLAYLVGVILTWRLSRHLGLRNWRLNVMAITAPAFVAVVVFLLARLVLKPFIGFDRPEGFDVLLEPGLPGWFHRAVGAGPGAPSGIVVRQTALCLYTWILSTHVDAEQILSRSRWRMVLSFNSALVVLALFSRVAAGSHDIFDAIAGLTAGIVSFWLAVVPVVALRYERAAWLVADLANVWLLFSIAVFFYSKRPQAWLAVAFAIYTTLVVEAYCLGHILRLAMAHPRARYLR